MTTHEMRVALREANETIRAADNVADDFAKMLEGRLRKVSVYTLVRLKKELSNFNAHTKEWKN